MLRAAPRVCLERTSAALTARSARQNTRPHRFAKAKRDIFSSLECAMPKPKSLSHSISGKNNRCILELFHFTRASQCPAWFRPGVVAVFKNLHAIDENVLYSDGVLVRFVERRPVRNCRGIKDDHVGEHPVLNKTAVVEAEIRRGQGA